MKIVFSRKGFDGGIGGRPSPIINGRPISLPIPVDPSASPHHVRTTYGEIGLGVVRQVTNGRLTEQSCCHHDPMFRDGHCAFGQDNAAQGHLGNQDVAKGDVFLFFGLFADDDGRNRHHRIFGYQDVECVMSLGAAPADVPLPRKYATFRTDGRHPHTLGYWPPNNTVYFGEGCAAAKAHPELCLSIPGGPVSIWRVPGWLREAGLTYHGDAARWSENNTRLKVVGRGQEFVSDITGRPEAIAWLEHVKTRIRGKDVSPPPHRSDHLLAEAAAAQRRTR